MGTFTKPGRAIITVLTIVYILAAIIQLIYRRMVGTLQISAAVDLIPGIQREAATMLEERILPVAVNLEKEGDVS